MRSTNRPLGIYTFDADRVLCAGYLAMAVDRTFLAVGGCSESLVDLSEVDAIQTLP